MTNFKHSHHFFHSFCLLPDIKFDGQHQEEQIILTLRAHPITQLPWIINSLLLFFILLSSNFIFNFLDLNLGLNQLLFINIFGLIIIASYFWFNFLGWFFNVGLVTNERVLDIDFHSVIHKEVTMTTLSKIEDITAKTTGFFASFFNYGNVFIQTAGTEANIEFMNIPRPSEVVKIINQLTEK